MTPTHGMPPDALLRASLLQVMDHDVYTSNDAIGLVYVDLSPLFMRTAEQEQDSGRDLVVQGWFPLYDTLRGVRGALCLIIKVRRTRSFRCTPLNLGVEDPCTRK